MSERSNQGATSRSNQRERERVREIIIIIIINLKVLLNNKYMTGADPAFLMRGGIHDVTLFFKNLNKFVQILKILNKSDTSLI